MALFKILSGYSNNLNNISVPFHEGYCYFTKDNQKLYIDYLDDDKNQHREALQGDRYTLELDLVNAVQENETYIFNRINLLDLGAALENRKPVDLIIYNNSELQVQCLGANVEFETSIIYFNNIYKYDTNNDIMDSYNIILSLFFEESKIILNLIPTSMANIGEVNQIAYYNQKNQISGKSLSTTLSSSSEDVDIPSAKAVVDYTSNLFDTISKNVENLFETTSSNYNESIIGLSVDGTTVTYIKGDGSVHSFETQDTDTIYSLGTEEESGLTKLYASIGSAEDGTMTQKAIKTELDKKVGVTIDAEQNSLVFTI